MHVCMHSYSQKLEEEEAAAAAAAWPVHFCHVGISPKTKALASKMARRRRSTQRFLRNKKVRSVRCWHAKAGATFPLAACLTRRLIHLKGQHGRGWWALRCCVFSFVDAYDDDGRMAPPPPPPLPLSPPLPLPPVVALMMPMVIPCIRVGK